MNTTKTEVEEMAETTMGSYNEQIDRRASAKAELAEVSSRGINT